MACEVNNKEINSQFAELLVRPTYNTVYNVHTFHNIIIIIIYTTLPLPTKMYNV